MGRAQGASPALRFLFSVPFISLNPWRVSVFRLRHISGTSSLRNCSCWKFSHLFSSRAHFLKVGQS